MNSLVRKMTKRVFGKPPAPIKRWKIVRGDTVELLTGKDKGSRGNVIKVLRKQQRVVVEGVNLSKRFVAPTENEKGRIEDREKAIHISNVSLIDPVTNKTTRVRFVEQPDGSRARVSVDSGSIIPRPEILQTRRKKCPPSTVKCTLAEDALDITFVRPAAT
jgi:large subunit ribosomal protein L24